MKVKESYRRVIKGKLEEVIIYNKSLCGSISCKGETKKNNNKKNGKMQIEMDTHKILSTPLFLKPFSVVLFSTLLLMTSGMRTFSW